MILLLVHKNKVEIYGQKEIVNNNYIYYDEPLFIFKTKKIFIGDSPENKKLQTCCGYDTDFVGIRKICDFSS